MAYTVDEVSDTLGVPRPTLYRYLREYSVPHLRRAGKIYVPEESFDRIKEIRELHREGLDTESVRRRLREDRSSSAGGLEERLERISATLEDLGESSKPASNGSSTARALQTVLARQTLLISAVSNLSEMMEELLAVHGVRRTAIPGASETVAQKQETFVDDFERYPETIPENDPATNESVIEPPPKRTAPSRSRKPLASPVQRGKFGSLSRRRRRGILVVLLALLTGAVLIAALGYTGAFGAAPEETSEPPKEEVPASPEETSTEDLDAPVSNSSDQNAEETTSQAEEDYGDPSRAQPPYQPQYPVQDVAPGPIYQEQPIQQAVAPGLPDPGQPAPQPGAAGPAPGFQ